MVSAGVGAEYFPTSRPDRVIDLLPKLQPPLPAIGFRPLEAAPRAERRSDGRPGCAPGRLFLRQTAVSDAHVRKCGSALLPPRGDFPRPVDCTWAACGLYVGRLALAFGPKIALPKKIVRFVFTALSHRHVFPYRAVLGKSNAGSSVSVVSPRALITSGSIRGVVPSIRDALQWNLCGGWLEARSDSELHSRAVKCGNEALAHSPLSSLVPSLIFLLNGFL